MRKELNNQPKNFANGVPEYVVPEYGEPEGWVPQPENIFIKPKTTTSTATTTVTTIITTAPPPTTQGPSTVISSTLLPTTPPATTAPPSSPAPTSQRPTTPVPSTVSPTTQPPTTPPLTTPALTTPGVTTQVPTTTTPCPICDGPLKCQCPTVINTTVTLFDICANYNSSGKTLLDKSCGNKDEICQFNSGSGKLTNIFGNVSKHVSIKPNNKQLRESYGTYFLDDCDVFAAYTDPAPTICGPSFGCNTLLKDCPCNNISDPFPTNDTINTLCTSENQSNSPPLKLVCEDILYTGNGCDAVIIKNGLIITCPTLQQERGPIFDCTIQTFCQFLVGVALEETATLPYIVKKLH